MKTTLILVCATVMACAAEPVAPPPRTGLAALSPEVMLSAPVQAACNAGGGCVVMSREKLQAFGVKAFDLGFKTCKSASV